MNPIRMNEIPDEIMELAGQIKNMRFPQQGDTSDVGIIECNHGMFVLKRSHGEQYCAWLRRETHVLNALSNVNLPVPRVHLVLQQEKQCWAVLDYLEGETVREALSRERDRDKRHEIIYNFGRMLAKIHGSPCPDGIKGDGGVHWLDQMLIQANFNLDNYPVDGDEELLHRLMADKPQPITQTLIHGDFTIDNVLVHEGKVTGVIDWSGGGFGDPRYDVSLAIRSNPNAFQDQTDRDTFFEGYGKQIITDEDYTYFADGLYEFF